MNDTFQISQALAVDDQNVLVGDYPKVLDFRNLILTHVGKIRLSDSESIEVIRLPAFTFSDVEIENLPNLKEIHIDEDGPTWLVCRNLPKLKFITADGSLRWLSIDGAPLLLTIEVGKCERLGYFSVRNVPALERVNVEHCRLLPGMDGLDEVLQMQLGVTQQIEALQSRSRRDSTRYERMTFTDIDLVLANISRGEVLLKRRFWASMGEHNIANRPPCEYSYRLLGPGEDVYTGGTGEAYSYAFEVSTPGTAKDKDAVFIDYEVGIHEPEDAIDEALSWAQGSVVLSRDMKPTHEQVLGFINVLLRNPNADLPDWIYSKQP